MPETYVTSGDLHRAVSQAQETAAYKIALARLETADAALKMARDALSSTPVIIGGVKATRRSGTVHVEIVAGQVADLTQEIGLLRERAEQLVAGR